ncbi:hypothetical protein QMG_1314, partial [Clostridioides difficile DA00256]
EDVVMKSAYKGYEAYSYLEEFFDSAKQMTKEIEETIF